MQFGVLLLWIAFDAGGFYTGGSSEISRAPAVCKQSLSLVADTRRMAR